MKKTIMPVLCLMLGIVIGTTLILPAGAADSTAKQLTAVFRNIEVIVNGGKLEPKDAGGSPVEPFIVDGSVYVPVRAISEALGMEVTWHDEASIVEISNPGGDWTPSAPVPTEAPSAPSKSVTVSSMEELAAAIASDTCITLKAGVYDVSSLAGQSQTLVVSGVEGLTLQAQEGAQVELVTPDRFSEVISFVSCNGITLRGIQAGHSVTGEYECDAGVVSFYDSANLVVDGCYFYGCGSIGINMYDCASADIKNTTVTDCSLYGVYLSNCVDLKFTDCKFVDNRAYGNVIAGRFVSATFTDCEISGNQRLMWGAVDITGDILFDGCIFKDNALVENCYAPVIGGSGIQVKNCQIEKAGFNLGYWKGAADLGGNVLG